MLQYYRLTFFLGNESALPFSLLPVRLREAGGFVGGFAFEVDAFNGELKLLSITVLNEFVTGFDFEVDAFGGGVLKILPISFSNESSRIEFVVSNTAVPGII